MSNITNAINKRFILANAGIPLVNMSFVNAFANISTIGQNNLYTVPAGYRALIPHIIANAQASSTANVSFQNSGTYYNAGTTLTSLTAGTPLDLINLGPLILESGEILSVILGSGSGTVNVWPQIILFDNSSPLKSVKTLNLVSGNNLAYTCPAGKTAIITDRNLNFGGISATTISNTGSGLACYYQYVPNGQSAGSGFRFSNNVTVSGTGITGGTASSSATRGPSLNAGDSIYVNCAGSLAICSLFNLVEY
jgi:hypothetical protein